MTKILIIDYVYGFTVETKEFDTYDEAVHFMKEYNTTSVSIPSTKGTTYAQLG